MSDVKRWPGFFEQELGSVRRGADVVLASDYDALKARLEALEATLPDLASPDFMVKYRKLERDAARLAEWDKAADFYRRCKVDPRSHEVGAMRDAVEWLCSIAARAADSEESAHD